MGWEVRPGTVAEGQEWTCRIAFSGFQPEYTNVEVKLAQENINKGGMEGGEGRGWVIFKKYILRNALLNPPKKIRIKP
jgi:hypothetical protein